MSKKIKTITDQKAEALKKVEELERLEKEAQQDEINVLKNVEDSINSVAAINGMFCGVILNQTDLVAIFDLALKTGEAVKIPFRLYFNE